MPFRAGEKRSSPGEKQRGADREGTPREGERPAQGSNAYRYLGLVTRMPGMENGYLWDGGPELTSAELALQDSLRSGGQRFRRATISEGRVLRTWGATISEGRL